MSGALEAYRIEIRGIVQGVGFRPFVYRTAHQHGVHGWVRNDGRGVSIHAEGTGGNLAAFFVQLSDAAPPAAQIAAVTRAETELQHYGDFQILASDPTQPATTRISPDLPMCSKCTAELHDPSSSRFLYPYINCTECGPRYSIILALPYDRSHTTMASWPLCAACRQEYEDPLNRRYHAQPTACNSCGPHYQLTFSGEVIASHSKALLRAATWLASGKILAIKGIGGYHLACDARNVAAVTRLRERKFRKEKPFAIMVRDLEQARALAVLNDVHVSTMTGTARPIVLARARASLPAIAPDTDELGIMLPYAPLHELLFHFGSPSPLVLTSANRSSEPIAYSDEDALDRLAGIADGFLIGERPIARRVDDSVVSIRNQQVAMVRRARGYAPGVVARLPTDEPILAVGADLKNTVALVVDGNVIVSQHIGDLGELETDQAFEQTIHDLLRMYDLESSDLIVAHDSHPEYFSTRMAKSLPCRRAVPVQHHRAHIASVLAEHGRFEEPVLGVAWDGTGYGDDGAIWGGELFRGSVATGFVRATHLRPVSLPGGDAAARFPVQAAAGFLAEVDLPDLRQPPFSFPDRFFQAQQLVAKKVRCFPCTSAGRLFDTVAALCGFTRGMTFEGQAAIWLEHLASDSAPCAAYPFPGFDHRPLLQAILADRQQGRSVSEISFAFHAAMAAGLLEAIEGLQAKSASEYRAAPIVFSGGVFHNRLFRELLTQQQGGKDYWFPRAVPVNDGGISLGQAALACFQVNRPH